jgi:hypothetical protein
MKIEFVKSCRFRKTAQPAAQFTQLSGQGYSRAHAGRPMAENAIVMVGPPGGGGIDALDPARDAHGFTRAIGGSIPRAYVVDKPSWRRR